MNYKNPIDSGCFADPESRFYGNEYYIYVTRSLPFAKQLNQDCFVSKDLKSFEKVTDIIDMSDFPWVTNAVWARVLLKRTEYILHIRIEQHSEKRRDRRLEIAKSESPRGKFKGYLGKPACR